MLDIEGAVYEAVPVFAVGFCPTIGRPKRVIPGV